MFELNDEEEFGHAMVGLVVFSLAKTQISTRPKLLTLTCSVTWTGQIFRDWARMDSCS